MTKTGPPPPADQIANGRALAVCVAVLCGLTAALVVLFVTGVVTA